MVVLIEIPFFLSLFVSFYKECPILKRNDFCLDNLSDFISEMALWLYNKLLQNLIATGISDE